MALIDRVSELATAVRTKLNLMSSTIAGKANAIHTHDPEDVNGLEQALQALIGISVSKYWGDSSNYNEFDEQTNVRRLMLHSPSNNVSLEPLGDILGSVQVKVGTAVAYGNGPAELTQTVRFRNGLLVETELDEETGNNTANVSIDPDALGGSSIPSDEELFGTQWNPDGYVEVSTSITLDRDMWYSELVMLPGGKIDLGGHRIFCSEALNLVQADAGAIFGSGWINPTLMNGSGATGGAPYTQAQNFDTGPKASPGAGRYPIEAKATMPMGTDGTNGRDGLIGGGAPPASVYYHQAAILGGRGGQGGTGGNLNMGPWGPGGGYVIGDPNPPIAYLVPHNPDMVFGVLPIYGGQGGGGGGSGIGNSAVGAGGGAGGIGGPLVYIAARTIVLPDTMPGGPIIVSKGQDGGNGANATNANTSGGAGGGGGGGGTVQLVFKWIAGSDWDYVDPLDFYETLPLISGCAASIGGKGGKGGNGNGTAGGGSGGQGGYGGYVVLRSSNPVADLFNDPLIVDASWDEVPPAAQPEPLLAPAAGSDGSAGQIVTIPDLWM